jgi:hypothetical protein
MTDSEPITQELLKQIVHYSPETGIFTWLPRPDYFFGDSMHAQSWNSRFAGKQAGSTKSNGYVYIIIFYKPYLAHRLAFLYMTGKIPAEIDHVFRNPSDNRWEHLRSVTRQQNKMNVGVQKNNTSGHRGVAWCADRKKWAARICVGGRTINIGRYTNIHEAIEARRVAEAEFFGEYAPQ